MIKREFTILMVDPKTKLVPYVWKGTSEEDGYRWLESVQLKEKFKGLEPVKSSRLLIMNRRINHQKAVMWLNIIVGIILIAKLLTL